MPGIQCTNTGVGKSQATDLQKTMQNMKVYKIVPIV